jgi:threonine/homoserine/homoserine lactone efflux protein
MPSSEKGTMMISPTAILITILGTIMVGAMSPGPSFVMVSRLSIARSRVDGLAAAVGIGLGGTIFATLALAGVTALLTQFIWFYVALKVFGGAYLIFIAARIWLGASAPIEADAMQRQQSTIARSFGVAILTQLSNPKAIVVYASVFAAVLPRTIPPSLFVSLPVGIFLVEASWYALVALVFSSSGPQSVYLRAKKWIDRAAAGLLSCLGLRLIYGAVYDR